MAIKQYNYNKFAKHYDVLELKAKEDYEKINDFLNRIFKKNRIKNVLDMTCGTGAQAIGLSKRGYKVTASDISKAMLNIAEKKAKDAGVKIKFYRGDIRTSQFGKFDAVIAIFNAVGHLSKKDFEKAIKNVSKNLNKSGLFIFDIFNLDFMKAGGFINYKYIDRAIEHEGMKYVRFNKNKINLKKGIMGINQETYIQKGIGNPQLYTENWDMQIYSIDELKKLLKKNGFKILNFYNDSGNKFIRNKSLFIFTIAKKV